MDNSYRTVQNAAQGEFVEKRSRFIGAVCPVSDEESALKFINGRRKEFWDATHNVYAYVLREGQTRRYSDDGEPQGTAGIPALDVLLKEELTDCAVVITRYFGGVLLGTGGLVRAYSHGAKLAADAGGIVEMRLCYKASIDCDYSQYGRLASMIPSEGGVVDNTVYTDRVKVEFTLPRGLLEPLQAKITEFSAGSLAIELVGERYVPFKTK